MELGTKNTQAEDWTQENREKSTTFNLKRASS